MHFVNLCLYITNLAIRIHVVKVLSRLTYRRYIVIGRVAFVSLLRLLRFLEN